ncbi:hypothetical protein D3C76_981640 [compost metagenome]
MHAHLLQSLYRLRDGRQNRDAHVFDKHFLGRRRAPLHAVEHDHVGPGLHRQLDVVVRPARADLHVDRFFPIGDFAQLGDLYRQVIGTCPVRVTAGAALVDADRQGAHAGHPLGDFHAQQHAAATGFGALPQDDFDGIGLAQVVRVHAVARRQVLIDQVLRLPALLRGHAAVTGGGAGTGDGRATAQGFLGIGRQRTETHAGDGHRNLQVDRLLGEAVAEDHIGAALFPIAFQRVARHAGAQQQQIIEVRDLTLGATAADVIDASLGGALDFLDGQAVEGRGLAQHWRGFLIHICSPRVDQYADALSTLKLYN